MSVLELEDPRWLDFVQGRPDASIFHHPAWARLLADCYGYRAMVVALTDRGGAVTAGLPVIDVSSPLGGRRWVSLPFTDSCPLLSSERTSDLVAALLDLSTSRGRAAVELRAALPEHPAIQRATAFVRQELTLAAETRSIWERLWKNHRRNVRIAEKAGVRIVRGSSASDLETFYRLHLGTRRRLGVPVQPLRFFRLLWERVLQRGLGFALTAYAGAAPVAAAIFGSWNGTLVYKYSARDERFAKLDANYLLLWTAIRSACEEGHRVFDLGRSSIEQTQLRSFKSGWGAREEPLSYSWIGRSAVRPSSRRLEKAIAPVIRNSTPWLCRAIGELFYRFAA